MNEKNKKNKKNKRESWSFRKGVILFFVVMILAMVSVIIFVRGSEKTEKTGKDFSEDIKGGNEKGQVKQSNTTVVIDPGHGGNDPGKVSSDGVLEKDVNLQIAFCLKAELEERGYNTVMLRETDTNLAIEGATNKKMSDMKNRVSIINDSDADILISVHQNSYSDPSVRGPQVFYDEASKEGEEFALILQEGLNSIVPEYSRKCKSSQDYYILEESVCTGVIVECGFMSCPEETALLTSVDYQQKIASAIADAIEKTYN